MKKREKKQKNKSTVFLLFCVSFCDELTVVFRSFVCSFSTNSYSMLLKGEGISVSFSLFIWKVFGQGGKNLDLRRKKERQNDLHDGKRK